MAPLSSCPDENQLSVFALGQCTTASAAEVSAHLESCVPCRESVALVALSTSGARSSATKPAGLGAQLLLAPSSPVPLGEVLVGKYQVLEFLGSGGMGIVVRAKHLQLNTFVALKFIRPELAHDENIISRFSREARSASRLKSPHANRVLDLELLPDGQPFMVMEYLEGETLEARLEREGPLSESDVLKWMKQALDAVCEAHRLGIVHRDLKPANLFLRKTADGGEALVVLDFGVAKSVNLDIEQGLQQTTVRGMIGSPAYMAPEQVTPGVSVDARVDVWALGCTMYTLLTGTLPFRGADFLELAWEIRNAAPARLPGSVSPALRACVRRCLERSAEGRFQSAQELQAALMAIQSGGLPTSTRPKWVASAVGAAAALTLIGVGVVLGVTPAPAPEPKGSADRPAVPTAPTPAVGATPAAAPTSSAIPSPSSTSPHAPSKANPPPNQVDATPKSPPSRVPPPRPKVVSAKPAAIKAAPVKVRNTRDAGVDEVFGKRL